MVCVHLWTEPPHSAVVVLNMCKSDEELTFDLVFVVLGPVQVHGSCVTVERVNGVGVGQQLGQKRLKDVGEVCWNSRTITLHCVPTL